MQMNLSRSLILLIVFLLLVFSCDKTEQKPDFPLIFTGEVTGISTEGALFTATFKNIDSKRITDFGIIWSESANPTSDSSFKYSFPLPAEHETYSYLNTSSLKPETKYFVRAFVEYDYLVYYGKTLLFFSKGSAAPNIADIKPSEAVFGDTVEIKIGEPIINNIPVSIYFNEDKAIIAGIRDSSYLVIVPDFRPSNSYFKNNSLKIKINRYGRNSKDYTEFKLLPPECHSFYPNPIHSYELLTITGKGFSMNLVEVTISNKDCKIISKSFNQITCKVPPAFDNIEDSIFIYTAGRIIKPGIIKILAPSIESYSPDSVFSEEKISFYGENLDNTQISILIGDQAAKILYRSDDSIVAEVPGRLCGKKFSAKMQMGNDLKEFEKNLIFKQPANIEVEQIKDPFYGEDVIRISANFLPDKLPVVYLNNSGENYNYFTYNKVKSSITFRIPVDLCRTNGWINFRAEFCNSTKLKIDSVFKLPAPHLEVPVSEAYNFSYFQIKGENFNTFYNSFIDIYIDDINYQRLGAGVGLPDYFFRLENSHSDGIHLLKVQTNCQFSNTVPLTITNRWKKISDTPEQMDLNPVVFNIGNYIYMGGGSLSDSNRFYSFNLTTGEWVRKAELPYISDVAFATDGTSGYLFSHNDLYRYDPINDTWTIVSSIPFETDKPTGWTPSAFIYSNHFYSFSNAISTINYFYDFDSGKWDSIPPVPVEAYYVKSVLYNNDKAYIFNGPDYIIYDLITREYIKKGSYQIPMTGGYQSSVGFEYKGMAYFYEREQWVKLELSNMKYSGISGPPSNNGNQILRIGDKAYMISLNAIWEFDLTMQ